MATWPSVSDIKSYYAALNQGSSTQDARLVRGRARAIAEIKSKCAARYAVSTWDTTAPDALIELVYPMAYGFARQGVHVGRDVASGDAAAADILRDAREQLAMYVSGEAPLLSDSDGVIEPEEITTDILHKRTEEAVFTMERPETQFLDYVAEGEEWED